MPQLRSAPFSIHWLFLVIVSFSSRPTTSRVLGHMGHSAGTGNISGTGHRTHGTHGMIRGQRNHPPCIKRPKFVGLHCSRSALAHDLCVEHQQPQKGLLHNLCVEPRQNHLGILSAPIRSYRDELRWPFGGSFGLVSCGGDAGRIEQFLEDILLSLARTAASVRATLGGI